MREVCEAAVDKEKEAAPLSAPAAVCSPQCTPALRQCPHLCAPPLPHLCAPHSSAPCPGCIAPVTRALAGHTGTHWDTATSHPAENSEFTH